MTITEAYIQSQLHQAEQEAVAPYLEMEVPPEVTFRCAAVLVPLGYYRGEWHVLYTRRTDRVESHKGQVSFPGGACDDGETSAEVTALREAHEEIGLVPADVRVLGRLQSMITISSFEVTPVVAAFPLPYTFTISTIEVARVFTMPLEWLARPENYWELTRREGRSLIAYHPYDGELLWGATARMTVQLIQALNLGRAE